MRFLSFLFLFFFPPYAGVNPMVRVPDGCCGADSSSPIGRSGPMIASDAWTLLFSRGPFASPLTNGAGKKKKALRSLNSREKRTKSDRECKRRNPVATAQVHLPCRRWDQLSLVHILKNMIDWTGVASQGDNLGYGNRSTICGKPTRGSVGFFVHFKSFRPRTESVSIFVLREHRTHSTDSGWGLLWDLGDDDDLPVTGGTLEVQPFYIDRLHTPIHSR